MPSSDAPRLYGALQALHRRALADHRLAAELQRARREFFGVEANVAVRPAAELRFVEWALLERESLALAAIPVEVLRQPADDDSIADSMLGVFRIESVTGENVEAFDLQEEDTVDVLAADGALAAGDLLVGRLYPAGRGSWQPSPAIAIYRPGKALAEAFARDVKRLELDRRLTQIELERLLLQQQTPDRELTGSQGLSLPTPVVAPSSHRAIERIEAELESVLAQGGAPGLTTHISDSLAQSARAGAVTGPFLEQLAFETKVDLDRTRRLLLELWNAHHASEVSEELPAESEPKTVAPVADDEPASETLGQRLARVLDEGLSQKRDVEELFRQLEEMAGIEPDENDEDDALVDAGRAILDAAEGSSVEAGDLAPLVTEHLWETQQSGSHAEATLQMWVGLQQNAAIPHTNVDDVTSADVMRLLLHVYLKAEPMARAAAVRSAFASIEAFSRWCEETQELSLADALLGCKGSLLDHLERLQNVGASLTSPMAAGALPPSLLRVEDTGDQGFGVRCDEGSVWILAPKAAASLVRVGDLLLAALVEKGAGHALTGPVVALPPDAESLIG